MNLRIGIYLSGVGAQIFTFSTSWLD